MQTEAPARFAATLALFWLLATGAACSDDGSKPGDTGGDAADLAEGSDQLDADVLNDGDRGGDGADTDEPDAPLPEPLTFPEDFLWGAATAAHQIEGGNTNNNWYQFETLPQYAGQTAAPSGQAANSYELWETDNDLVEATHLDAYRFSIEWSRIEPQRGVYDEEAIAHYRAILEDLDARGIRPFVTLHHFTDPIWLNDLSDLDCETGPSDANLCGWPNPDAVASYVAFARLLAEEYGDLVDDWSTFNEPNTYTHIGYLAQLFPPGAPNGFPGLPDDAAWLDRVAPVVEAVIEAHVGAYDAIREADTEDADGDGTAATVGWTMVTQYILPADPGVAADVAAADAYRAFLNYIYTDAVATGDWDPDLDGVADESHPEWVGKQDFIGVQFYTRTFVVDSPLEGEILVFVPCQDPFRNLFQGCPEVDELNMSFVNEVYPEGLYAVIGELAERYPGVPLPVTENGAAADNGERKAQILVRHLEQVQRAVEDGLPVPAYYAWSLIDNFEWADGFEPRFGLYETNFTTFERTPTRAQEVYAEVAESGVVSRQLRATYATGPLLPDESSP